MAKTTSIAAYASMKNADSHRQAIYKFVLGNPGCTRIEISRYAKIPINSVSGRVRELLDDGVLYEKGTAQDPLTKRHGARLYVKPRGRHERRAA